MKMRSPYEKNEILLLKKNPMALLDIWTNLVPSMVRQITSWVDERRAVDVLCLRFSKAFNALSHNILIHKLMKYGLDKRTARWTGKRVNCQA